jgi:DNA-directed RNA polymerase beta' subunit
MSELNELIASSSVHAYNSGIEQGRHLERDRIVDDLEDLLREWRDFYIQAEAEDDDEGVTYWHMEIRRLKSIIDRIKGEK